MTNKPRLDKVLTLARRAWLPLLAALLLGVAALVDQPAWAAPGAQTVPLPTPTEESAPPAPTRAADNNDDQGDGGTGGDTGSNGAGGSTQPDIPDQLTGIVNAVQLNVRGGPGADFDAVGTLAAGAQVNLLARNGSGGWWLVCCAANGEQGWVNAQFVAPNGLTRAEVNAVLVEAAASGATTPAPAGTPAPDSGATEGAAEDATDAETAPLIDLAVTSTQSPKRVRQGDALTVAYQLTNPGDEAAVNVVLRSEIPAGLALTAVTAAGAEQGETPLASGGTAVLLVWPAIAPGATVTADVAYTVDEDVADGSVIDVIAAIEGDNVAFAGAGVSVGMPPVLLPTFQ